jgi:glycine cleavage system H lipoate-binding protein
MMVSRTNQRQRSEKAPSCIWKQAGVVRRKECHSDYACETCRFDKALHRAAKERHARHGAEARRRRIVSWQEKFQERHPSRRPCIHHLKGKISFKACAHGYNCKNCEFDQFFVDQHAVHAVVTPVGFLESHGIKIPQGYYLHRGHMWLKIEGGDSVRIGLDDFASRVFGPVDRIESPLIGKKLHQGRPGITLRRGAHEAKALSPVSGVVTSINPRVREKGSAAGQDPYSDGWVATVHADALRSEIKALMIHRETIAFMDQETERLYEVMEETVGPLSADGGFLGFDVFGNMPQLGWDRLARDFLRN